MNNIQESVAHFRQAANELLKAQADKLKEFNDSRLISGKLARFTVFNAHLNILRKNLDREIASILNGLSDAEPAQKYELENALRNASVEYVNEYLCISFVKDDY